MWRERSGASASLHAITSSPFDRFRAIHDLIGHARTGFGFELQDEIAAWRTQDQLHSRLARWALATEILGVNSALSLVGETPDHKAMLFEPQLLRCARVQSTSSKNRDGVGSAGG